MAEGIFIYSVGLCCASVCAPVDMPREVVAASANARHPTGLDHGWKVSDEEFFSDGETPNGGVVECTRGTTRHWLLIC